MKRFFATCAGLTLAFSAILLVVFNYSTKVIFYHLVVMGVVLGAFAGLLLLLAFISQKRIRALLIGLSSALFLFQFLLFYVFVLGSNHFWHKTITLSILKNYTASFSDMLAIIPVQKGIILGAFLLYVLLNALLFIVIRPKTEQLTQLAVRIRQRTTLQKWLVGGLALLALAFIFRQPIMQGKRTMHMAEEPLLQFTLGAMWGNNNDIAFDKLRYENGLRDKACTDSVKRNTSEHTTVIILIDGLRADHLPMYGYSRNTTPFLDSLHRQKQLMVVNNAFSTSTNTIGGIAGLFFSKDWMEFGFNGLSLMKFFKKAGFTTYAFLTGFHRDWYGLSALYRESCDVYYESSDNPDIQKDDDLVTLKKISESSIQKKSFVFIHLLSVHLIGIKHQPFKKFLPDKIGFSVDKRTALINNYDNGIVQSDYVVRQIFEKLKKDNLLQNSTVYILSDHGELFGENGSWGHGDNIHENLLTVPVLIYDSQQNWYNNLDALTLKDIAPTIIDRIGSPIPACWEGRSLHQPATDFSVEVNSAEECVFPHGVLYKQDSAIQLQIMDTEKKIIRTVHKKGNRWSTKID